MARVHSASLDAICAASLTSWSAHASRKTSSAKHRSVAFSAAANAASANGDDPEAALTGAPPPTPPRAAAFCIAHEQLGVHLRVISLNRSAKYALAFHRFLCVPRRVRRASAASARSRSAQRLQAVDQRAARGVVGAKCGGVPGREAFGKCAFAHRSVAANTADE